MEGLLPALRALCLLGCACCAGWAAVSDLRCRLIPRASCYGLALLGALYQLLAWGASSLIAGAAFALATVAACRLSVRVLGRREHLRVKGTRTAPLGGGDVRLAWALCLATGAFAPAGMALCGAVTAAVCAGGVACGKLKWDDGIPLAPFLALWPVGSLLAGM